MTGEAADAAFVRLEEAFEFADEEPELETLISEVVE